MTVTIGDVVGALKTGEQLLEYRVEGVLGHGGFGITYLARDTHLDKMYAIKEFLPTDLAARIEGNTVTMRSEETRESFEWAKDRFIKEARVLARFAHPNLIQVHRFFEENGTAYFVMDYAEGRTLSEELKTRGKLPEKELLELIAPLVVGLQTVHRAGVLHRDIKPGNIILRSRGGPVLIDFGAARQDLGTATKSLLALATAGFAPIEQYGASDQQGPETDVYAFAAVAYRAISGETPVDAITRLRNDPLIPATVVGRGAYSPALLAAIDWGLAVNAEDRPADIGTWLSAMQGKTAAAAVPVAVAAEVPDDATIISPRAKASAVEKTELQQPAPAVVPVAPPTPAATPPPAPAPHSPPTISRPVQRAPAPPPASPPAPPPPQPAASPRRPPAAPEPLAAAAAPRPPASAAKTAHEFDPLADEYDEEFEEETAPPRWPWIIGGALLGTVGALTLAWMLEQPRTFSITSKPAAANSATMTISAAAVSAPEPVPASTNIASPQPAEPVADQLQFADELSGAPAPAPDQQASNRPPRGPALALQTDLDSRSAENPAVARAPPNRRNEPGPEPEPEPAAPPRPQLADRAPAAVRPTAPREPSTAAFAALAPTVTAPQATPKPKAQPVEPQPQPKPEPKPEPKPSANVQPQAAPAPKPAAKTVPQVAAVAPATRPRALVAVKDMATGSSFQDCDECPTMLVIPAGRFQMGSEPGPGANRWEKPAHRRIIRRPLAVGRSEITVGQWDACTRNGPCQAAQSGPYSGDRAAAPVVFVNWTDARQYAAWLSARSKRKYRLPTEAEWEYAARAGTTTTRFWGDSRSGQCEYANGADQAALRFNRELDAVDCNDGYSRLAPVASFQPNNFGLYDVAGNVAEWVEDCWTDDYQGAPRDAIASQATRCSRRVIRGGSWLSKAEHLRSPSRGLSLTDHRSEDLGFRLVAE